MREALLRVIAAALTVSLLDLLPVKKSLRRIISAGCGALLLLTLMEPVLTLRDVDPEKFLSQYRMDERMINDAVQAEQKKTEALITEQTEAYILDKAASLGARVRVEVTLAALSESYSYPYALTLTGRWTPRQQRELSAYLSTTLGIPPERQTWREGPS